MTSDIQTTTPSWIALDWGTTHLRVWAMGEDNQVLAKRHSDQGMGKLSRDAFEPALLSLIHDWLPEVAAHPAHRLPVMACGMVGAKQGWVEAPYRSVPGNALGAAFASHLTESGLQLCIIAGLKQDAPPDVMRGEETQIAGFLRDHPGFSGLLCLPGSHTKWVQMKEGAMASFQTFMTGELFATLSNHTVLRHSLGDPSIDRDTDWDAAAFLAGVEQGSSLATSLVGNLFSLRAESLLHGQNPGQARARLSGMLIGAELAAFRTQWTESNAVLIGADGLSSLYSQALAMKGCTAIQLDGEICVLKGLISAYSHWKEQL